MAKAIKSGNAVLIHCRANTYSPCIGGIPIRGGRGGFGPRCAGKSASIKTARNIKMIGLIRANDIFLPCDSSFGNN